jgi:hypothetical protein
VGGISSGHRQQVGCRARLPSCEKKEEMSAIRYTSVVAYQRIKETLGKKQREIWRTLVQLHEELGRPITPGDIARSRQAAGLDRGLTNANVCARLLEIYRRGMAERTDIRTDRVSRQLNYGYTPILDPQLWHRRELVNEKQELRSRLAEAETERRQLATRCERLEAEIAELGKLCNQALDLVENKKDGAA